MNLIKYITINFSEIWKQYCENQSIGYKIIEKEDFSADTSYIILWGYDLVTGIRIIMVISYSSKAHVIPLVFVDMDIEKQDFLPKPLKFPIKIKLRTSTIGNFHFQKKELLELSKNGKIQEYVLIKKCESIDEKTLETISRSVHKRSQRKGRLIQKRQPRSVRTISAGLYGLGKNRKH